jgi:dolichol-phosphate mannosyltransferase
VFAPALAFPACVLLVAQTLALLLLWYRLWPGRRRSAAIAPAAPSSDTTVTVIVATLNEAHRIAGCLQGLHAQGAPMLEVLVVDSNSTDGTREMVQEIAAIDARFQLLDDGALPAGWVGKVWALETGLRHARGEWVLGVDADTSPAQGMIASIVQAMRSNALDVASFAPRFVGNSKGERWLQPAMLVSLVYRTGAAGAKPRSPDRVLANGQCFIARRTLLQANGGFSSAKASFSDDVTLARHLAARGARVGFLDGSRIIDVQSYKSMGEMWREWGRSFDLKDGTSSGRRWHDVAFIWLTMALPIPVFVASLCFLIAGLHSNATAVANAYAFTAFSNVPVWVLPIVMVNALLLMMRGILLAAIRHNYAARGWSFWLSWLADIPAAVRLTLSTARRPNAWRGRTYSVGKTA